MPVEGVNSLVSGAVVTQDVPTQIQGRPVVGRGVNRETYDLLCVSVRIGQVRPRGIVNGQGVGVLRWCVGITCALAEGSRNSVKAGESFFIPCAPSWAGGGILVVSVVVPRLNGAGLCFLTTQEVRWRSAMRSLCSP